jgi:adenylate cyclase class IV
MTSAEEHHELREFINDKFNAHEDLEALRFKRIDELLTQFGKEVDSNEETIKRVHIRVDRIETRIKTVQGMGTAVATALGAVAAWLGMSKN